MKITMQSGAAMLTLLLSTAAVHAGDSVAEPARTGPSALPATAGETIADATAIDFSTVDKDSSRTITIEEAAAVTELHDVFNELDEDRNLFLTPNEFAAWPRAGKVDSPKDPTTVPGGSAGAQHVPEAGDE